jgi:hypothetical protein
MTDLILDIQTGGRISEARDFLDAPAYVVVALSDVGSAAYGPYRTPTDGQRVIDRITDEITEIEEPGVPRPILRILPLFQQEA